MPGLRIIGGTARGRRLRDVPGDRPRTQMGWEIYPEGLHNFLPRMARDYVGQTPIYVTEKDRMRHFYVIGQTGTGKSVFLKSSVAEEIKRLKQQDGPDIQVHGSANFIQTLLKHDLVDAFWLKIFPVALGMGKRLFAEGTIPAAFTLSESMKRLP